MKPASITSVRPPAGRMPSRSARASLTRAQGPHGHRRAGGTNPRSGTENPTEAKSRKLRCVSLRGTLQSVGSSRSRLIGSKEIAKMTMIDLEEIACRICGEKSLQFVLHSIYLSGTTDLDLRLRGPGGGRVDCWLQQCWHCGMVAPDLARADRRAKRLIKSPKYLSARSDKSVPDPAPKFVCRSLIDVLLHQNRDAFANLLAAAWVADDAGLDDAARDFRTRAAALLGQEPELENEEKVQLLDVLRRAGRWGEALSLAEDLANVDLDYPPDTMVYLTSPRNCRIRDEVD